MTTDVIAIGLYDAGSAVSPVPLYIATTFACLKFLGMEPWFQHMVKKL